MILKLVHCDFPQCREQELVGEATNSWLVIATRTDSQHLVLMGSSTDMGVSGSRKYYCPAHAKHEYAGFMKLTPKKD